MELPEIESSSTNDASYQKIELCPDVNDCNVSIFATKVDVLTSPMVDYVPSRYKVASGSLAFVKLQEGLYCGNILDLDTYTEYFAYIYKHEITHASHVCVGNFVTNWTTHLTYENECKDISFAQSEYEIWLGSVDICGQLFVHKITNQDGEKICPLIHIVHPLWGEAGFNRIFWCMPDDNEYNLPKKNLSRQLLLIHDYEAEVWNIETVVKEVGCGLKIAMNEVKTGFQVIPEHESVKSMADYEVKTGFQILPEQESCISAGAFSINGNFIAIGNVSGHVITYNVKTSGEITHEKYKEFVAHNALVVSSIYFLNFKFRKFAVTCADNNTEIKLWNWETWTCLQSLKIHPNAVDYPLLKAAMDGYTCSFLPHIRCLLLSDIKRKVLFVLLIQTNIAGDRAMISSISEFKIMNLALSCYMTEVSYEPANPEIAQLHEKGENRKNIDVLADDEGRIKMNIEFHCMTTESLENAEISFFPNLKFPFYFDGLGNFFLTSLVDTNTQDAITALDSNDSD